MLYNRTGADQPAQRLLFLVASVPAGIAAVAVEPASTGDSAIFAASLALTRPVLAAAHGANHSLADLLRLRITRACLTSAVLFALSIWTPEPSRYLLIAYWFACSGIGIYLLGTRVFLISSRRVSGPARALLLVATFQLARLEGELSAHAYVWLLAGRVVMCAVLTTRGADSEEIERYLAGDPGRPSRRRRDRASSRRSA